MILSCSPHKIITTKRIILLASWPVSQHRTLFANCRAVTEDEKCPELVARALKGSGHPLREGKDIQRDETGRCRLLKWCGSSLGEGQHEEDNVVKKHAVVSLNCWHWFDIAVSTSTKEIIKGKGYEVLSENNEWSNERKKHKRTIIERAMQTQAEAQAWQTYWLSWGLCNDIRGHNIWPALVLAEYFLLPTLE